MHTPPEPTERKRNVFENHPALWQQALPWPGSESHKYSRGHVLIAGGYPMTGAARLAARAAARIGAGLTTVLVSPEAFSIYATALTSIIVKAVTTPQDWLASPPVATFASSGPPWGEVNLGSGPATDLRAALADPRVSAMLIGPGAGVSEQTRRLTLAMLSTGRAVVVDADAITALAHQPGPPMFDVAQSDGPENGLSTLRSSMTGPCVWTPHEGEFERFFGAMQGDKLSRARQAAATLNAVMVLKGHDTVIAAPDGTAIINNHAPPYLATAGSGDVLSGMITGLLSQGMPPLQAAAAAVWLHGEAAASFGIGLLAEDLPDLLPKILSQFFRPTSNARYGKKSVLKS